LNSGPKPPWISVLMKFSHSCRRLRSQLPLGGASPASGFQVRQVLHDGRPFGQHLPVVALQRGHVTLGVDRQKVAAVGGAFGLVVHAHQREGQAQLAQHDVRRQRAGVGGVIQLHRVSPEFNKAFMLKPRNA